MYQLEDKQIYAGKVTYVTVCVDAKGARQVELGVLLDGKLLGQRIEAGVETIPETESYVRLHLDEAGDAEGKRRRIAREQLARLCGVELADTWEHPGGYLRLCEDSETSLVPDLLGLPVTVAAKQSATSDSFYLNLYFPRERPKPLTAAQIKARARPY